jgi:hypothetical protein
MLRKGILNGIELFKTALGFLGLSLNQNNGAAEFVGDLVATALQFLLAAGKFFETFLLLLDLILTLAELEKFGLRPLDLILKFLSGGVLLKIEQFVVVFVKV